MKLKRISAIVALLIVVALMPSCGDTFHQIAFPIISPSGNPNTVSSVFVVFTGDNVANGQALQINLSGDTVTAAVALGLNPVNAFINDQTSVIVISDAGAQAPLGINTVEQFFSVLSSFSGSSNTSLQSDLNLMGTLQGQIEVPGKVYTNSNNFVYVIIKNPNDPLLNPPGVNNTTNEYLYGVGVIEGGTNVLQQEIGLCPACTPTAMIGSNDGSVLLIAEKNQGPGGNGQVFIVDQSDNTVTNTPLVVEKNPQDMAITSDNSAIYVMNQDSNTLSVINAGALTVNATDIPVGNHPTKLVYDPKLLRLYVINGGDNSVTIINADPNATTANGATVLFNGVIATVQLGANANPVDLVPSPDGTRFYVANQGMPSDLTSQTVAVYSALNNTLVTKISVDANTNPLYSQAVKPTNMSISPDSSKLLVAVQDINYTTQSIPGINAIVVPVALQTNPKDLFYTDGSGVLSINTGTNQVSAILPAPFTSQSCGNSFAFPDPNVTNNTLVCTRMHPIAALQ